MSNLLSASINLHPSKKALLLYGSLYFLAGACVIYADLYGLIKILLVLSIILDAVRVANQLLLRSKKAIHRFVYQAPHWYGYQINGEEVEMLVKQLISFRKIIILRFTLRDKRLKTLIFFEDNMSAEDFHYFLVLAKINCFQEDLLITTNSP